ncbi:MAG: hypothetical protein ACQEUM_12140 [Pseudomonadota bacterium]
MSRFDARVARLESLLATHADSDPRRIWAVLWELGHDLPHPLECQSCREWLGLVPTDALHELLESRP